MSEKSYRFFSDGGSVPTSARQSVHCVPVIVRALGPIEAEGTHKERRQKAILMKRYWYTTVNILPFSMPAHAEREPRRDGVTAGFRSKT